MTERQPRILRLRTSLFLSYGLLLVFMLITMSAALIVFFSTQPAPRDPTFNHLAAIVQGINVRDVLNQLTPRESASRYENLTRTLDDFALTRQVRVMWLTKVKDQQLVLYDTAMIYPAQTDLAVNNEEFFSASLGQTLQPGNQQIYGSFTDPNGVEWLYGGVTRAVALFQRRDVEVTFLVAETAPTVSLGQALAQFSSSILPALLRAMTVSGLLALFMGGVISRSLIKPLKDLLMGVRAVTKGNYEQQVPESGPLEVRELAQEFNVMSSEVRATQHAQRDFLANVSHDLKTPLTSIQGYAQAVMDGAARDPGQAARIIYEEAGRMNRLVNELTDLIRMQAGGLTLKMTSLDANIVVSAIVERLMVVAQQKGVEMTTRLAPLPPIGADGDRLAQVLTNLLSNAIKFTPNGGRVLVSSQAHRDGIQISVQDSGIGIPAEDLPRLFERFYQVDKARGPQRGTGLGLAIAQEIVHAHGGQISIHSDGPDQGTRVLVVLPVVQTSGRAKAAE